MLNWQGYYYGWFKCWRWATMYAGAAFGILTKTDDSWTHYAAVTRHRFIKLAHRRCLGTAVMLWLTIALANWLTTGVPKVLGDLQNKISRHHRHQHRLLHSNMFWLTDSTLWQSILEFSEHFGVAVSATRSSSDISSFNSGATILSLQFVSSVVLIRSVL